MKSIERMVLYVEPGANSKSTARTALSLARRLGARLFAVWVMDSVEPGPQPRRGRRPDVEEKAWRALYEIEDDAFAQDTSISLLLEQGRPLDKLLEICSSYDAGLVVVDPDTKLGAAELLKRSLIPVLFANGPKEAQ